MLCLAAIVIKATMNTCLFIKAYMILLTLQVADVLTAHNWVTVVCNSQLGYSSLFTKSKCILIDFLNLKSIVLHISLILFKDVLRNFCPIQYSTLKRLITTCTTDWLSYWWWRLGHWRRFDVLDMAWYLRNMTGSRMLDNSNSGMWFTASAAQPLADEWLVASTLPLLLSKRKVF